MKISPFALLGMVALAWWVGKQSTQTVEAEERKSLEQQAQDMVKNLQKQGLQV